MYEYQLVLAISLPLVFLGFLVSLIFLVRCWKKRTEEQTTKLRLLFQIDYSCLKATSTGITSNKPSTDTSTATTSTGTSSTPSMDAPSTSSTDTQSTPYTPSTDLLEIGGGNFSAVYLAYFDNPTNDQLKFHKLGIRDTFQPFPVAAKLLVPRTDQDQEQNNYRSIEELPTEQFESKSIRSIQEELIIRKLEHENILRIYGLCKNFEIRRPAAGVIKRTVTVFEHMDERDCKNFIRHKRQKYTQLEFHEILCSIFLDVSNAIVYLQGRRIVHRDIALRNIFLHSKIRSNRPHIIAKLGDFGLAREAKTKIQVIEKINRAGKEPTERLYSYYGCLRRENETLDESILPEETQRQTFPNPRGSPDAIYFSKRECQENCCQDHNQDHTHVEFSQKINRAFFTFRSDIYCFGAAIWECLELIGSPKPRPGPRLVTSCLHEQCDETAPVNGQVTNDITPSTPGTPNTDTTSPGTTSTPSMDTPNTVGTSTGPSTGTPTTRYCSIQVYQGPSSSHQVHSSTVGANTGTIHQLTLSDLVVLCMKPEMIYRVFPEQLRDLLKGMLKKHTQPREPPPPKPPQIPNF